MHEGTQLTRSQQATVRRLWLEEQRRSGVTVPVELWCLVEAEDYFRGVLDSDVEEDDLRGAIAAFIENKWPRIAPLIHHQATTPRASGLKRGPHRIYRKPLPHRLGMLELIAPRVVPAQNLLHRSLDTGRARLPRGTWPQLADAWNTTHPLDLRSPDDFRALLWQARRDDHLRETYFDRLFARWARYVWGHEWKNVKLFQRLGLDSPEDRLEFMALAGENTDEYIRRHREHQERTQSLPPLSEEYMRSDEYIGARREHQQRTRHLGKSKTRARKR